MNVNQQIKKNVPNQLSIKRIKKVIINISSLENQYFERKRIDKCLVDWLRKTRRNVMTSMKIQVSQ